MDGVAPTPLKGCAKRMEICAKRMEICAKRMDKGRMDKEAARGNRELHG
jgi:hypothetical protein